MAVRLCDFQGCGASKSGPEPAANAPPEPASPRSSVDVPVAYPAPEQAPQGPPSLPQAASWADATPVALVAYPSRAASAADEDRGSPASTTPSPLGDGSPQLQSQPPDPPEELTPPSPTGSPDILRSADEFGSPVSLDAADIDDLEGHDDASPPPRPQPTQSHRGMCTRCGEPVYDTQQRSRGPDGYRHEPRCAAPEMTVKGTEDTKAAMVGLATHRP